MLALSPTPASIPGSKDSLHLQVREGLKINLYGENDIASIAPVSSVRTTAGDILLPPEMYGSPSAITGGNLYERLVNELIHRPALRLDADQLPPSLHAEHHGTGVFSEESIVPSAADVVSGVKTGPPLPNQYGAGFYPLATEPLDTEPFGFRITSVSRASAAFFMCHINTLLYRYCSTLNKI